MNQSQTQTLRVRGLDIKVFFQLTLTNSLDARFFMVSQMKKIVKKISYEKNRMKSQIKNIECNIRMKNHK